jgi:hypothetical protein
MSHAAFPIVLAFVGALRVAVYLMRHRRHLHASYPARRLLRSAKRLVGTGVRGAGATITLRKGIVRKL